MLNNISVIVVVECCRYSKKAENSVCVNGVNVRSATILLFLHEFTLVCLIHRFVACIYMLDILSDTAFSRTWEWFFMQKFFDVKRKEVVQAFWKMILFR